MPRLVRADELIDLLVERARRASVLALLFDYDGTLTEIVPRPEDARLAESTRAALVALARHEKVRVAIVTGRSLAGLRRVAGELPGCLFAANGGFHLSGPDGDWIHPEALARRPLLAGHARALAEVIARHPGAELEDKELSLSLHYRRAPEAEGVLGEAVEACLQRTPGMFRVVHGKAIFELQPDLAWDKGRALQVICERWGVREGAAFFGDDRIDEPAFVAVHARGGLGCIVGGAGSSSAELALEDVAAMREVVGGLAARR